MLIPDAGDDLSEVTRFLSAIGLRYEEDADVTVVARDRDGPVIGTGSLAGKVIKHLGVAPDWRGSGVAGRIFDKLYEVARVRGISSLFVFTARRSSWLMESLGFKVIEGVDEAVLLEFVGYGAFGTAGLEAYLDRLRSLRTGLPGAKVGAIVMNANPFTLGHLHLIETAAAESDKVIVFTVTEDRSAFPTEVRLRLIKAGVRDMPGVVVVEGGDYVISEATFPRYFLREPEHATRVQARLDATIFARKIAPAAGIVARYVGEEPYCTTTEIYNEALAELLPPAGIRLRTVPRAEVGGVAVSASSVRAALKCGDWATLERLVPETTLEFLRSVEAHEIIERLRRSNAPH